ncbi:MAG: hypothetical protein IRZ10_08535 [Thermoflavifilum sp.]|nr:hypothetical protein [Thermoflavifilum sp.]MCL6514458.1 hypothetical protein [Alicyclobacillus sp.]
MSGARTYRVMRTMRRKWEQWLVLIACYECGYLVFRSGWTHPGARAHAVSLIAGILLFVLGEPLYRRMVPAFLELTDAGIQLEGALYGVSEIDTVAVQPQCRSLVVLLADDAQTRLSVKVPRRQFRALSEELRAWAERHHVPFRCLD